eukprot:scaffold112506_cov63-Phaeocystis_antarctica.AAC.1
MVRICLFALVALVGAAKKAETDCTVKSVWPDGTELERCAAAAPLQSRPQQAPVASCIPPWHAPACTGSASSRARVVRRSVVRAPTPPRPRDASHTPTSTTAAAATSTHPSATRHATHARTRHRRCGQGREQGLQVDEGHAVALEQLARRHLPRRRLLPRACRGL